MMKDIERFNHSMMDKTKTFCLGFIMIQISLFLTNHCSNLTNGSEWLIEHLQNLTSFMKVLVLFIAVSSIFALKRSNSDDMQKNRLVFTFVSGFTEGVGIASISIVITSMIYNLLPGV